MSKLLVINEEEGVRAPFLRGILVRSLQSAGMEFDSAYEIATRVRDELAGELEIAGQALRRHVLTHLPPFGDEVVKRYAQESNPPHTITVQYDDANNAPYSRGRQRLGLLCAGLTTDEAVGVAAQIHAELLAQGLHEISHADLRRITYETVLAQCGKKAGKRYLSWQAFRRSGRPLILLIGGATASGKSTVATQLSHVLDIVRTQSTDMLREVMRMMIPERLMPVLHQSTFEAWQVLPQASYPSIEDQIAAGYEAQTDLLRVSSGAVLGRALREGLSIILEGIHVHPGMLDDIEGADEAIAVEVMLAVLKPKDHRRRIRGRSQQAPARRANRYLKAFDAISALQTHLLGEADKAQIPIVPNDDVDATVRDVILVILRELSKQLETTPAAVLG